MSGHCSECGQTGGCDCKTIAALRARIEQLEATVAELVKELDWYANPHNYPVEHHGLCFGAIAALVKVRERTMNKDKHEAANQIIAAPQSKESE